MKHSKEPNYPFEKYTITFVHAMHNLRRQVFYKTPHCTIQHLFTCFTYAKIYKGEIFKETPPFQRTMEFKNH